MNSSRSERKADRRSIWHSYRVIQHASTSSAGVYDDALLESLTRRRRSVCQPQHVPSQLRKAAVGGGAVLCVRTESESVAVSA